MISYVFFRSWQASMYPSLVLILWGIVYARGGPEVIDRISIYALCIFTILVIVDIIFASLAYFELKKEKNENAQ